MKTTLKFMTTQNHKKVEWSVGIGHPDART